MDRELELANIIFSLGGKSSSFKPTEKNKELLASADSLEVAHAQQRVIEAGMDLDDLFVVWQQNRRVLPDLEAAMRRELPDNHILQRILAEHDMIMCFIADLEDVNIIVQNLDTASSYSSEIRRLEHIVCHLGTAVQHPEREDQVIFPELQRRGFPGPSDVISLQHHQLGIRIQELQQITWSVDQMDFAAFKKHLQQLVDYVVPVMRRHIFIENNLVLPLALELIDDPRVWDRIKNICEEIGYCGYDAT